MTIKPAGRTLAEFQPLKPAEQKLLDACKNGKPALISAERPEAANDENTVRAAFLRFLALGGDEYAPVHEKGVQLSCAWIKDVLDMEATSVPSGLYIHNCLFDIVPVFRGTKIASTLNLGGCQLPGFFGDGLTCEGDVFLNEGFTATGEVLLLGAQIGGDLNCGGAIFHYTEDDALSADRAVIKGSVFLNKGCSTTGTVRLLGIQIGGSLECSGAKFDSKDSKNNFALLADRAVIKGSVFLNQSCAALGAVQLLGAQIGGNLVCEGAKFDGKEGYALSVDGAVIRGDVVLDQGCAALGTVRLLGAQIGGDLVCEGATFDGKEDYALSADGMTVKGTFFFRDLPSPVNGVSLADSHVGCLADDKLGWGDRLVLYGFTYDCITGDAPTDATTRLAWLNKQNMAHAGLNGDGAEFRPQPWKQLAKVLREMGHAEDARQVSIEFEHRLRKANLIGQPPKHWGKMRSRLYRQVCRTGHLLFRILTGYGYRPLRLLVWMLGVWLFCAWLYWCAALNGVFAPSNPLIFQNPEYAVCRPDYIALAPLIKATRAIQPTIQGAGNWYLCEKLREEYSGFSPLAYSLDVLLPLVDLQQETSWSPLIPTPKETWYKELFIFDTPKHWVRLVLWLEILFGWVSSLLLVAVVSGLTKRREE
ncbi:MAG: hypothetical protein Q7T38_06490 [Gallionella sp.]|nr:hypothetical protein [Gallionella sp.]